MKKKPVIKTDISKQYIINLYLSDESLVVPVVCNVEAYGAVIIATAAENPEMFQKHRFNDEFFQWLLYTGKIKLYNNNDMEK